MKRDTQCTCKGLCPSCKPIPTAIERRLVEAVVLSLESFIDAKIAHARRVYSGCGPMWVKAAVRDVNETRYQLHEQVTALVAAARDE